MRQPNIRQQDLDGQCLSLFELVVHEEISKFQLTPGASDDIAHRFKKLNIFIRQESALRALNSFRTKNVWYKIPAPFW